MFPSNGKSTAALFVHLAVVIVVALAGTPARTLGMETFCADTVSIDSNRQVSFDDGQEGLGLVALDVPQAGVLMVHLEVDEVVTSAGHLALMGRGCESEPRTAKPAEPIVAAQEPQALTVVVRQPGTLVLAVRGPQLDGYAVPFRLHNELVPARVVARASRRSSETGLVAQRFDVLMTSAVKNDEDMVDPDPDAPTKNEEDMVDPDPDAKKGVIGRGRTLLSVISVHGASPWVKNEEDMVDPDPDAPTKNEEDMVDPDPDAKVADWPLVRASIVLMPGERSTSDGATGDLEWLTNLID